MRAYICVSYSKRKLFDSVVSVIKNSLAEFKIEPFVFIDNYSFTLQEEKEMMLQAMQEINNCDLLIAEISDKSIGVGIEVGYAKAKQKPVIYLRHKDAEHSTTTSGISDFQIIYSDSAQLQQELEKILQTLTSL